MNRALLPPTPSSPFAPQTSFNPSSGHRENSDRCECHGDGRRDNESYLKTRYILLTARYDSVHSRVVVVVPPEIDRPDLFLGTFTIFLSFSLQFQVHPFNRHMSLS